MHSFVCSCIFNRTFWFFNKEILTQKILDRGIEPDNSRQGNWTQNSRQGNWTQKFSTGELTPTGGKLNFPREILKFSNWFPDCGYFRIVTRIADNFELFFQSRIFLNCYPDCGYFRIVSRIAVIFELLPGLRIFSNCESSDCDYFLIDTLLNRRIFSNC